MSLNSEFMTMDKIFRGLFDAAPDAMVVVDDSGKIVLVNAQTERMFGFSREQLVGEDVEILMPERACSVHREHRADYSADPHARPMGIGFEVSGVRRDGSEFLVEISLSPLEMGERRYVLSAIRDLGERASERQTLRESEERFRRIFQHSNDAIFIRCRAG